VNSRKANASRSLLGICLNGPLGMKRGRGMRQKYSTTGARKQEGVRGRGWFTYGRTGSPPQWGSRILGIGEIRGAGVFGKGKRVSPGQDEIRSRNDVAPEGRRNEPLPGHF